MKIPQSKLNQHTEEQQPWVTCFLPNILLTHVEQTIRGKGVIDYPSLFTSIEGFEIPGDPESYLKDVHNWVPLTVLWELHLQCEKISGKKDIAYHAARGVPNILLTHVEQTIRGKGVIDYPSLFTSIEGFEIPGDPESYLKDVHNWVPLTVLWELHLQCEKISGKKHVNPQLSAGS